MEKTILFISVVLCINQIYQWYIMVQMANEIKRHDKRMERNEMHHWQLANQTNKLIKEKESDGLKTLLHTRPGELPDRHLPEQAEGRRILESNQTKSNDQSEQPG